MATLAEKVRLRLNAVGDDFYPDEFIVDCLNKAQDHVVSTMINMEKASAQMGSRKSLRALDDLRETEIGGVPLETQYARYKKVEFPVSTSTNSIVNVSIYDFSKTIFKIGRELFNSQLFLLEHGNLVPTKNEFFYNFNRKQEVGTYARRVFTFSGTPHATQVQTVTLVSTINGQLFTITVDSNPGETLAAFVSRIADKITEYKLILGFDSTAVTATTITITAIKYGNEFTAAFNISINGTGTSVSLTTNIANTNPTFTNYIITYVNEFNEEDDVFSFEIINKPTSILLKDIYLEDLPNTLELAVIYKACSYALVKEEMGEKQIKASEQFEALFQREFQGVVQ